MLKGKIKRNVDNTNEEARVKSSEEEEIKIPKCSRKSHAETVDEEMKKISSEEEYIRIRKFRRRSRVDIMKKKV